MRQIKTETLADLEKQAADLSATIKYMEQTPTWRRTPYSIKTLNSLRAQRGSVRRQIIAHPDSPKQLSLFDPPIK